jgi:hypothetical protein
MPIKSNHGVKEVARIIMANHQGIFQDGDEMRPMMLLNYGLLTIGPIQDNPGISIFVHEPLFLPTKKNGSKSDYCLTRLIDNEPCDKFRLPLDAGSVEDIRVAETPQHVYENMERGVYTIDDITKDEKAKMILSPEQFNKLYDGLGEAFTQFASMTTRDRQLSYLKRIDLETIQFIIKRREYIFNAYLSVPSVANTVLWKSMID